MWTAIPNRSRRSTLLRHHVCGAALLVLLICNGCGSEPTRPDPEQPGPTPVPIGQILITINTADRQSAISPYIYGSNQDRDTDVWTVRRQGGNRITGYNWENNFSNAGSDWQHSSDRFSITNSGLSEADGSIPGRVLTSFHERSIAMGAQSIVSLQMAGYVARDAAGTVNETQTAPSSRWDRVEFRKAAPFSITPDPTDGMVYMDEMVNFLVQRYGPATSPGAIRWYSLDNEPALWAHTHPRIHPTRVGVAELVERSVELAAAVKAVDPAAGILGPALYGMGAFLTLQDAPDWDGLRVGYDWFIDYYLERMRDAELKHGLRLLDVLDVHWYPEARGDNRITEDRATTPRDVAARLQAPRTLWDPSYTEVSWIGDWLSPYLPLLPRLRESIDRHYPGTRLAITEYNYGGGSSISGGMAQADVLGAFGKYGVYIANLWGIRPEDSYTSAAFKLYRNYDGRQGTFGNTSVPASTSDRALSSVYASIHDQDLSALHVILLNKHSDGAVEMQVQVNGARSYGTGQVWGFDESSSEITQRAAVAGFASNSFSYVVPALTAVHLVLK